MRRQLITALRMTLVLTVILGLAYPLALTGFAQLTFGAKADGSLVKVDGQVVGSRLLGQAFTGNQWFQSRPSAAGAGAAGAFVTDTDAAGQEILGVDGQPVLVPVDADDLSGATSGASNLGPTNPELLEAVTQRATAYRETNGLPADTSAPVDAVTSSGSGVDPHISVANARLQATRVADTNGLDVGVVLGLVDDHTEARPFGFLGEPGVNVLELNLAVVDAT
ncbi:MAG: potassium-transporting ATPase subunit C [Aquihabitans sp.]